MNEPEYTNKLSIEKDASGTATGRKLPAPETPAERVYTFRYQKPGHKKYTVEHVPESKLEDRHRAYLLDEISLHLAGLPLDVQEAFIGILLEEFRRAAGAHKAKTMVKVPAPEPEKPKSGLISL
jgi:hypothetical protein